MEDIDMAFQSLLALAQIALAVIAVDAVSRYFLDFNFLTGILKQVAYAGALVGAIDQVAWLVTERIPKLLEM